MVVVIVLLRNSMAMDEEMGNVQKIIEHDIMTSINLVLRGMVNEYLILLGFPLSLLRIFDITLGLNSREVLCLHSRMGRTILKLLSFRTS